MACGFVPEITCALYMDSTVLWLIQGTPVALVLLAIILHLYLCTPFHELHVITDTEIALWNNEISSATHAQNLPLVGSLCGLQKRGIPNYHCVVHLPRATIKRERKDGRFLKLCGPKMRTKKTTHLLWEWPVSSKT